MAGELNSGTEFDGQWDVLSVHGSSDPEYDENVVCREDLSAAEVHPDHFRCPASPTATSLHDIRGGQAQFWGGLSSEQVREDYVTEAVGMRYPLDSCDLPGENPAAKKNSLAVSVAGASSEFAGMQAFLSSKAGGGAVLRVGKDLGFRLEFTSNLEAEYGKLNPFDQPITKGVDEIMALLAEGKEKLNGQAVTEAKAIVAEQGTLLMKCNSYEKLKYDEEVDSKAQPSPTNDRECEAWCIQETQVWRAQSRHINPFWSIALAAALMGLLILGHKWQQERHQNQQLQLQLCDKDEKISQLMVQVTKLKHTLSTRHHHGPICPGKMCYHGLHNCF